MTAETVVPFLVDMIVTQLEKEASLLAGVSNDFNEIKDELNSMNAFLKEAEKRRHTDAGVEAWVEQVRDAAYDVEDIIDKFIYYLGQRQGVPKGLLGSAIRFLNNNWYKHKIGNQLQDIKVRVKAISERKKKYCFHGVEDGSVSSKAHRPGLLQQRRELAVSMEDDDIVGVEKEKELLLGWLLEDQKQRTVVSVYGMGGSGKTTLVAKVYKSPILNRDFDCSAWITVSQTYAMEDVFRTMITEFGDSMNGSQHNLTTMSNTKLVETLRNYLQNKRYVIVLDDVWSINVWEEISVSLPQGVNGSRVILTTRQEDVACFSFGNRKYVHHLQPLNETDSWVLFCKKAFSGYQNTNCTLCPPELEEVALRIVHKCEGLPLAIVAMGGLMSCKNQMPLEWKKVYDSLNWELSNNPTLDMVKSILLLSYNDLPYHLKHCFLHCCLFPEDYIIQRKRLIRLWIAEGFIEERKGMTSEEVAETYLMELIYRSILHVVDRNHFGRPKSLRVHDILRELALWISKREKFCAIYDDREGSTDCRRLSVVQGGGDGLVNDIQDHVNMSNLRSFFLFSMNKVLPSTSKGLLPSGFKLLRVLDLQGVPITSLPDDVVDLFNLRYLNLRDTQIAEIPGSLGRLKNLEILDVVNTKVEVLPRGVIKLKSLTHLLAYHLNFEKSQSFNFVNGVKVPSAICKLRNLQFLTNIEATDEIIKQVGNMTQLRTFGIRKVRWANGVELCNSIQRMNHLSSLSVMAFDEQESLEMDALSTPPPVLHKLILVGKLQKVPLWFPFLHNLTFLYLQFTRLEEDPLPSIHALPLLGRLILINAYEGKDLLFHSGWFPKLKNLCLGNLPRLNQVTIDKGAIPNIEKLCISSCGELWMVPEGIEHLSNLKTLRFEDVGEELVHRLRGKESVDRPRIRYIPRVDLYYWTSSGWLYESLSSSPGSSSVKRTDVK